MRLSRRTLVLGAAALVGCAQAEPIPPTVEGSSEPPMPSSRPSPTSSPSPSFDAARYESMKPTQWGLDIEGIVQRTMSDAVALTFDACGGKHGSGYDKELIEMLRRSEVPATLFLNSRWIEANRAIAEELVADPLFAIGNHGTRHLPLSVTGQSAYGIPGTESVQEVIEEIVGCQEMLTAMMGEPPRFFRPGTAFYDDVAVKIVLDLGLIPVGFDVNGDGGATFSADQVSRETRRATAGSIVIAHFNQPQSGTARGMADAILRMTTEGTVFARLDDVL